MTAKKQKEKKYCCLLCGDKISDDDFAYEDYYKVTRGHNKEEEAFICFDCYQYERRGVTMTTTKKTQPQRGE